MATQQKNQRQRRSVSWEFFTCMASVMLCGVAVMCLIETALSARYFAEERRNALTGILDGAVALGEYYAREGDVMTRPGVDDNAQQNAREGLSIFNTATDAVVFFTDSEGNCLVHSGEEAVYTGAAVPTSVLARMGDGQDVFVKGTMEGFFSHKYYTVGRAISLNGFSGYLFAATDMRALNGYVADMFSMFVLSAGLMLLVSSVLSILLARHFTEPIRTLGETARRLGSGDFTARAPVEGCDEIADFAASFNNMAARLQTIDNSRGQFMGNIAHELRTPMTSIKGFIDGMLDDTIPPEDHKHYLEIVSQETGRLSRLVQNMLDITRLEAGEYKVKARCYDLRDSVTGVVLADEQRIEDGHLDVEGLDIDRVTVFADPDLVHQVVYNIVDNAIKFTPAGGVIRFKIKKTGNMVETSIENTGAGIAPEALPFVFERFYKEDRSRGLNTRGSGLGLHICKVLIGLSGGTIHVESEEGQWCRFTFTLPAGDERTNGPEEPRG